MEIKFHSMDERPVLSCEVFLLTKWFDINKYPYSRKHMAFGVRDEDTEDIDLLKADVDCYIAWVYADELRWQMVKEYEIHG